MQVCRCLGQASDESLGPAQGVALLAVWDLAQPGQQQKLKWRVPHAYHVTSGRADLLLITTPGGIEGMFRHAGRDLATPRSDGFEIPKSLLAEASELYGGVILGPPR
ncbi:MAG: hypothetical protein ACJ736_33640 [Streptomyces sp.]